MKEHQDRYGETIGEPLWIRENIHKMVGQISQDARLGRPLPLSISMSPRAYASFIQFLKSQNAFFPSPDGNFDFLKIPVRFNPKLPDGTFTVERFDLSKGQLLHA